MVSDFFPAPDRPLSTTDPTDQGAQEQFLRFHLVPDTTVMLPISQLAEVLTIPIGQIIPIPHMPAWVMGVYNWRGEILWIVDLGHLVGLTPWHQQTLSSSTYKAVVLHSSASSAMPIKDRSKMLGLVVNRVEDIEWCNPNGIQSPPSSTVTPELAPFLRGYWLKPNGEMIVTLDGEAIVAGMPKS
ncbi:MAG: chemotaxis protein CheW [Xenococcaceae cyanobacterium]